MLVPMNHEMVLCRETLLGKEREEQETLSLQHTVDNTVNKTLRIRNKTGKKKISSGKKKCYHTSKYSSQFHTDLHTCGGIGAGVGSFQLYANMCVIIPICLPKGLPMLQGDADK